MRGVFLILAATAAVSTLSAPAAAERRGEGASAHRSSGHVGAPHGRDHRGDGDRRRDRRGRDRDDRDDRRDVDLDLDFGDREYQGDTLWRSEGFNDWWHDRPDRAFPRWVAGNRDCERKYWAGGGWRC